MAASHNDSAILSADVLFQNRVKISLIAAAIAITTEAVTTAFHYARMRLAVQILNNPIAFNGLFASSVATDANVLSDATQAGTVVLTTANADAQQALVTDAHMDTAVSGQFNSFFDPSRQ